MTRLPYPGIPFHVGSRNRACHPSVLDPSDLADVSSGTESGWEPRGLRPTHPCLLEASTVRDPPRVVSEISRNRPPYLPSWGGKSTDTPFPWHPNRRCLPIRIPPRDLDRRCSISPSSPDDTSPFPPREGGDPSVSLPAPPFPNSPLRRTSPPEDLRRPPQVEGACGLGWGERGGGGRLVRSRSCRRGRGRGT